MEAFDLEGSRPLRVRVRDRLKSVWSSVFSRAERQQFERLPQTADDVGEKANIDTGKHSRTALNRRRHDVHMPGAPLDLQHGGAEDETVPGVAESCRLRHSNAAGRSQSKRCAGKRGPHEGGMRWCPEEEAGFFSSITYQFCSGKNVLSCQDKSNTFPLT